MRGQEEAAMGRILVADSDPHIRWLCQDELREEGYEVMVASNANEVLGLVENSCPDLVVLEIMLPDMSGMETLRIIKGTCSNTLVIFHSTYGLPETGADSQCDGVVLKTHDLASLKRKVQQLVPALQSAKNAVCRRNSLIPKPSGVCNGFNGN
jgi:two-component system, response regulator, stage 0 sporulation protein F